MKNMPLGLLAEILKDPFYKKCCITGETPVEFHHNFIYANNQVQEKWCILPLVKRIHDIEKRQDISEKLNWIMLNRADEITLNKYGRTRNLIKRRDELNKIYGEYKEKID